MVGSTSVEVQSTVWVKLAASFALMPRNCSTTCASCAGLISAGADTVGLGNSISVMQVESASSWDLVGLPPAPTTMCTWWSLSGDEPTNWDGVLPHFP